MFLKSLTLKGFKSFADPATLQLEPGVTVVVGPNGSGKSNVVDAVAWVLGAQGPRTVRSSKMEDVIFAGSSDRPALGRAEVSLAIDNRAGRLPGGLAEITITRTLFRSGDSEYAINGQPCRLLDVQELLSDSGVGRQQHVIVGQGQLDHILNARPEDRRAVIEEAAGVLKHRRRRERAERRMAATEENLDRLGDLLREVRRQMRPLERQAAAARSHAALADELRALRLHLVGRDLATLEERRRAALAESDRLRVEDDELRRAMAQLDVTADTVAAELSARRDEDYVVSLTRAQGLAERCRGIAGVLSERRRSLQQALQAAADVDVVSTLEADAAGVAVELASLDIEDARLEPERRELEEAESALSAQRARYESAHGNVAELRSVEEAYAVEAAQLRPLRDAIERDRSSLERLDERLNTVEQRRQALKDEMSGLGRELDAIESSIAAARAEVEAAGSAADAAEAARLHCETAFRDAEGRRHRLDARAEALARATAEASGAAGAQALTGANGVLGVLSSLVDVDAGWGGALEAALGAVAAAVVVDGPDSARAALARLRDEDVSGSVLALGVAASTRGHVDVALGLTPLRARVRPRVGVLGPVLDALVADVVVAEDWRAALDIALAHPQLVVVTAAGDRFSPHGWVVGAGGAQAARLAAEQAKDQAAEAAELAAQSAQVLDEAGRHASSAAATLAQSTRQVERSGERAMALRTARGRVEAELAVLDDEWAESRRHRTALSERFEGDGLALAGLEDRLIQMKAAAEEATRRISDADEERAGLDERRAALESVSRDLDVRAAALAERRAVLLARSVEVERRLEGHAGERAQAEERRRRIEGEIVAVDRLGSSIRNTGSRLDAVLESLRELRARQVDEVRQRGERLDSLRHERAEADTRLSVTRQRLQALELELAESNVRHEAAVEALRRELGVDPADAIGAPCPELDDGVTADARATAIEQQLTSLGPVNPLALEELGALEERHRFLEEQVDDVRRSRRELQQLMREVDDEIMRVFTEAFADVNRHFQVLVATLFPGGSGRLTLSEPEDLLDTGVEVEARPAGKNVRKLSLLSGGERSLVALAFLFAVFRSRPSPFYLMDEVEAALDDVNLHRFLDLLHEFRDEAQLIIVSHQKRTMEAADALYGVTMTPGGSSKVVSQKVRHASGGDNAPTQPATTG